MTGNSAKRKLLCLLIFMAGFLTPAFSQKFQRQQNKLKDVTSIEIEKRSGCGVLSLTITDPIKIKVLVKKINLAKATVVLDSCNHHCFLWKSDYTIIIKGRNESIIYSNGKEISLQGSIPKNQIYNLESREDDFLIAYFE